MGTGVGQVGAFATGNRSPGTYKERDREIQSKDPRQHPNQAFRYCTENVDRHSHCTSMSTFLLSFPHVLLAEQVYTASLNLLMLDNSKILSASTV